MGFSGALSIYGNNVAVVAYENDGKGINSGRFCVYVYIGDYWWNIGDDIDGKGYCGKLVVYVPISINFNTVYVGVDGGPSDHYNGHVRFILFEMLFGKIICHPFMVLIV